MEIGLGNVLAREFINYRDIIKEKEYFDRLKRYSINYVTLDDEEYLENLMDLTDAPQVLYVRGKLKPSDLNAIAIVGSKKMTSYGKEVAALFSTRLSDMGIVIVSGLALGIDAAAHRGALAEGVGV